MMIFKTAMTCVFAAGLLLNVGCTALDDDVTVGESIDDAGITAKVNAALAADDDLEATKINVNTREGVVELIGTVDQSTDIAKATSLTRDIDGVKSVTNRLRVE